MRILGAIIAGGQSTRFGSDKALALLDGVSLIDIVTQGITGQVAGLVVCGRRLDGWLSLDDRPIPGLGPLGGLCAALHHASLNGYDAVLSVAADVVPIPQNLVETLAAESENCRRATFVQGQHLIGFWPSRLAGQLADYLQNSSDRSLYAWLAACGAVPVSFQTEFANINTRRDFEKLSAKMLGPSENKVHSGRTN